MASWQLLAQEFQVHQLEPGWRRVLPGVERWRRVVVDFVRQRVVRELVASLCREIFEVFLTDGVLRVDIAGDRVWMLRLSDERWATHMLLCGRHLVLVVSRQRLEVVRITGLLVVGGSRLGGGGLRVDRLSVLVLEVEEDFVARVTELTEHFLRDVGIHGEGRRGLVVVLRDVGLAAVDDDPVHRLRLRLLLHLNILRLLGGRWPRLHLWLCRHLGELFCNGDDCFLEVWVGEHLGLLVVRVTLVQLVSVMIGGAHLVARVLSFDVCFLLGVDFVILCLFLSLSLSHLGFFLLASSFSLSLLLLACEIGLLLGGFGGFLLCLQFGLLGLIKLFELGLLLIGTSLGILFFALHACLLELPTLGFFLRDGVFDRLHIGLQAMEFFITRLLTFFDHGAEGLLSDTELLDHVLQSLKAIGECLVWLGVVLLRRKILQCITGCSIGVEASVATRWHLAAVERLGVLTDDVVEGCATVVSERVQIHQAISTVRILLAVEVVVEGGLWRHWSGSLHEQVWRVGRKPRRGGRKGVPRRVCLWDGVTSTVAAGQREALWVVARPGRWTLLLLGCRWLTRLLVILCAKSAQLVAERIGGRLVARRPRRCDLRNRSKVVARGRILGLGLLVRGRRLGRSIDWRLLRG